MTTNEIAGLGVELADFLGEFRDCFARAETRGKLEIYLRGQLSQLPRKSIEPIALEAGISPRSLQEFLASDVWDEDLLRAHMAHLITRDHADEQSIGIIDESGHPKKGINTPGVSRQYCGRTGKVDNCVMTVHLTYADFNGDFHTMVDSELYLPKAWDEDRERCRAAKIPDSVVYRPKYDIALEQLDRARAAGVNFAWITADEWYSQKPKFLRGLETRGVRYVLEIPKNFAMWLHDPVSGKNSPSKPVENLVRYSRPLMTQSWERYHIKDTDHGPMVWEVKATPCWLPRREGPAAVVGPYWLIVARNVLNPTEIKYFISNAEAGVPLTVLLHVAFRRWPVERCLQDEKTELGLSHFEVRSYPSLKRHLLLTQVSHLYLARQTLRLRGEKSGGHIAAIAQGDRLNVEELDPDRLEPSRRAGEDREEAQLLATPQRSSPRVPHQNPPRTPETTAHRPRTNPKLSPRLIKQGAL